MAHPDREAQVLELVEELDGPMDAVRIVWDRKRDRWDTGRRSMLAFNPMAQWHLVVQDDAILCTEFRELVAGALEQVGSGPAAFYMGRSSLGHVPCSRLINQARRKRAHWIRASGPNWGVAVAVRVEDIPPMIEWCDAHTEPQYDLRMMAYFESINRRCSYSVPSLVNHRIGPGNPSLIPGRGSSRGRQAAWWLHDPRSIIRQWSPRSIEV